MLYLITIARFIYTFNVLLLHLLSQPQRLSFAYFILLLSSTRVLLELVKYLCLCPLVQKLMRQDVQRCIICSIRYLTYQCQTLQQGWFELGRFLGRSYICCQCPSSASFAYCPSPHITNVCKIHTILRGQSTSFYTNLSYFFFQSIKHNIQIEMII